MTIRSKFLAATVATLMAGAALPAMAVTLRYANQGDLKSLDPYTLNETTTNAHLGHVYEGLTQARQGSRHRARPRRALGDQRGRPDLALLPAQGREVPQRQPVQRRRRDLLGHPRAGARARTSRPAFRATAEFVKVDDYTVDVKLKSPNPILNYPVGHLVHHGQGMGGGEQRRRRRRRPPRRPRATRPSTPTAPARSRSKATSRA